MSDILDYYKNYYKNGGIYKLEDYKGSSRPLMITRWLKNNIPAGARVLDIGCGDGTYAELMPEYKWTGIDINEEKKNYKGHRLVHDLEKKPYDLQDKTFDAVICSEVLEHLFTPETVHSEAHRLLKPRGVYIISTPNFDWIEHHLGLFRPVVYRSDATHTREHIRFYTIESHQAMLDKAGFTVVDCMGADIQFGTFFGEARQVFKTAMPEKSDGEVDYMIGRAFRAVCHTIGVLSVKR